MYTDWSVSKFLMYCCFTRIHVHTHLHSQGSFHVLPTGDGCEQHVRHLLHVGGCQAVGCRHLCVLWAIAVLRVLCERSRPNSASGECLAVVVG